MGDGDYLMNRDGIWHYVRRVPLAFSEIDKRKFVRQSTKIRVADDPRGARARRAVDAVNKAVEEYWRGLAEGQAAESKRRYDAARKRARMFGFDYAPAEEAAARPFLEVLARIERAMGGTVREDPGAVAGILGTESPPEITLSLLFDEYEKLETASIKDLSEDQKRKWRNPKKRAISNLLSVIGDKPIHRISRGDALDFRQWWQDRVLEEGVEIATANKDIGHLNRMIRTVDRRHRLGIPPIFADLRIEGEQEGQRQAFPAEFVQNVLLAEGAFEKLNPEARRAIFVMVETGLRLSEIVNLTPDTIFLDHAVPHIQVKPDGRRMKTPQSERDTPLVGVALLALRAQPQGFPRYRDNAATLSATVNKFIAENRLRPTPDQTLYSLRHTFEDRLTAVECPEKLTAALMGHKFHRPRYGKGPSLEQKLEWLQRIAFRPPSIV